MTPDPHGRSDRWLAWRARVDLDEYDTRWDRLAAAGEDVHGEADAVVRLGGTRVLDAGCGMGRVAVELSRRGPHVTGVDNDPEMVDYARPKTDQVRWVVGDLATVELDEAYDLVVMAGSVLQFVVEGDERGVVANMARHLDPGGLLVAGSPVDDRFLARYDAWCHDAGLLPVDRWSTWEGAPYDGGGYAVSVHRRAAGGGT